ncbi:flagellar hook-basal body complex protein FliE [Fibrobacterota bacterium]
MSNTIGSEQITGPVISPPQFNRKVQVSPEDRTSFGDMFKSFLNDVNHMQNKAGDSIQKMLAGEIKDPHQVMLAVGEAKMALNLLLEIRNKVMEGYQEIMHLRV